MILRSIRLENIRSYTSQLVNFPSGSVLLSGDIGAGKSTILLGVEFALFGIGKGALSGSELLRHGADEGSVELKFSINNQDYLVKRVLRRSRDIIAQSAGYIIKGDDKKEGTPQELKTEILSLLGYPAEILTKKSMIYRYTVYTPQEEMKQILQEEKEMRLDTLRKVFDIDRYKRISENSVIITRKIKEERKLLQGKLSDFDEKTFLLGKANEEKEKTDKELFALLPLVGAAREKVKEKKALLEQKEGKIKELNEHKKKLEVLDARMHEKAGQNSKNNVEIEKIAVDIAQMKEKISALSQPSQDSDEIAKLKKSIEENEKKLPGIESEVKMKPVYKERAEACEKEIRELIKTIEQKTAQKIVSHNNKVRVMQMNECPTCKQQVFPNHKQTIAASEDANIRKIEEELAREEAKKKAAQTESDNNKIKLEIAMQKEREFEKVTGEINSLKLKIELKQKEKDNLNNLLDEKNKLLDSKTKFREEIKEEVKTISQLRLTVADKIKEYSSVEEEYKKLKEDHDLLLTRERELEIKEAELRKELQSRERRIAEIKEELEKKKQAKEKLQKLGNLQDWLENYFTKLMATMERHVMAKVHLQFNQLFQQWFNVLLEDETITARLDEEFTPIVVQNGYETGIENLSGGEKTSLALAYRLALNKVINEIIGTIKTKDLIILDEPTDGFSTEQLDKVREVLEQLDTKQTIIVSHESKIESYVDNIIRISKAEHNSKVVS